MTKATVTRLCDYALKRPGIDNEGKAFAWLVKRMDKAVQVLEAAGNN